MVESWGNIFDRLASTIMFALSCLLAHNLLYLATYGRKQLYCFGEKDYLKVHIFLCLLSEKWLLEVNVNNERHTLIQTLNLHDIEIESVHKFYYNVSEYNFNGTNVSQCTITMHFLWVVYDLMNKHKVYMLF